MINASLSIALLLGEFFKHRSIYLRIMSRIEMAALLDVVAITHHLVHQMEENAEAIPFICGPDMTAIRKQCFHDNARAPIIVAVSAIALLESRSSTAQDIWHWASFKFLASFNECLTILPFVHHQSTMFETPRCIFCFAICSKVILAFRAVILDTIFIAFIFTEDGEVVNHIRGSLKFCCTGFTSPNTAIMHGISRGIVCQTASRANNSMKVHPS